MSSNKSFRGKMYESGGVLRKMRISTVHLSTLGGDSIYHSKGSKSSKRNRCQYEKVGKGIQRSSRQIFASTNLETTICNKF
jgi:hypothetical protein